MKKKGVNISHLRVEEGKTAVSQVELVDGERILGDYEEGVLETYVLSPFAPTNPILSFFRKI